MAGSEFGEKTGPNLGSADSEFGERTEPNPGLADSEFEERPVPLSELLHKGLARFFLFKKNEK